MRCDCVMQRTVCVAFYVAETIALRARTWSVTALRFFDLCSSQAFGSCRVGSTMFGRLRLSRGGGRQRVSVQVTVKFPRFAMYGSSNVCHSWKVGDKSGPGVRPQ